MAQLVAQLPRASLSPIPPFGLDLFEGSEEDLPDDSMSLAAFDTEDWSCSLHDSAPQWIDSQSASLQHRSHHMLCTTSCLSAPALQLLQVTREA